MTNLQIAVKVISDYLQQELSDDYYKDDFTSYRKLTSEIIKELKNRKVFR